MDESKAVVEHKATAKQLPDPAKPRPSLLGWFRKKLHRITRRKSKELEIYPLF
jgi:hypothetical protein